MLADIYLGKITKWNDPELVSANPKIKLPANDIVVIHRSDSSGTTYVWSDFLVKTNFEFKKKLRRDTAINWPTGRGGEGNQGVSALIQQTPYSLGYVELTYALTQKLSYGAVRNASGEFVKANLANVTAAADAAAPFIPDDFRFSIANTPAKGAYPVASLTWLVVPATIKDKAKLNGMKAFIRWMLGPGQSIAEQVGFSKLPPSIVTQELQSLAMLQ